MTLVVISKICPHSLGGDFPFFEMEIRTYFHSCKLFIKNYGDYIRHTTYEVNGVWYYLSTVLVSEANYDPYFDMSDYLWTCQSQRDEKAEEAEKVIQKAVEKATNPTKWAADEAIETAAKAALVEQQLQKKLHEDQQQQK